MFKLTGNLVYAPERGADFKKVGKLRRAIGVRSKTLILELPRQLEIARFYSSLIVKEHGPWCNLALPLFGMHVTIIRGHGDEFNEPDVQHFHGRSLTVTAYPDKLSRTPWAWENPGFWTIPVWSPELKLLRKHVRAKFLYEPHLTIARESPNFMHAKLPVNALTTAKQCLKILTSVDKREQNQQLVSELLSFINGYAFNPFATSEALMKLVATHVAHPAKKRWEGEILNLFKCTRLTHG